MHARREEAVSERGGRLSSANKIAKPACVAVADERDDIDDGEDDGGHWWWQSEAGRPEKWKAPQWEDVLADLSVNRADGRGGRKQD
jgi:hypothetical protein